LKSFRVASVAALTSLRLIADVSYDESSGTSIGRYDPSSFQSSGQMTTFDDPSYIPAHFEPARTQDKKVYIKGNKLARVGSLHSEIYDLDTGTVQRLDRVKRWYSTTTFAEAQREIDRSCAYEKGIEIAVETTGSITNISGEAATEYRISALVGKDRATRAIAHATYWIVSRLPSAEAASFRDRCVQKYPDYAGVCSLTESRGFGVLAKSAETLPGYPITKVVDARSSVPGLATLDPPVVSADRPGDPLSHERPDPAVPIEADPHLVMRRLRRAEAGMSNFVDGPVEDSKFSIPDGYKKKKALKH
jgi:hypothetical protein